jgi:L-fucose isomerase-like protein
LNPRIGFLTIGHEDYISEKSFRFAEQAIKKIRKRGIDIVFYGKSLTNMINAQNEAKRIAKDDIDGIIIFIETWIECSVALAVIRMIEHIPFLIWGFPMFTNQKKFKDSTGSLAAYSVLKGSLDRVGYKYKEIIGKTDDNEVIDKVISFCKAAFAYRKLKESRMGLIGYASMSMYTGMFDHLLLRRYIGPEVIHFDTFQLIEEMNLFNNKDCMEEIEKLKKEVEISEYVEDNQLIKAIKMYKALINIARKFDLQAITVKCQYELSKEFGMTACVPLSLLADKGIVTGCEGDIITLVSMLIFSYITNQTIFYGDALDIVDKKVLFSPCGFAPFSLATKKRKKYIRNFNELFNNISWGKDKKISDGNFNAFEGILSSNTLKPGKMTFGRLVEGMGNNYKFIYGTGNAIETELRQGIMPAIDIVIDGSIEKFVKSLPSQHFSLCYEDISDEIEDLCKILNIETYRI